MDRTRETERSADPGRGTALGIVTGLFLLGLGLRLWLSRHALTLPFDGVFYARVAQERLLDVGGSGLHPVWPSFFPFLIAETVRLLHPGMPATLAGLADPVRVEEGARLLVNLVGALLVWPTYVLARRAGGRGLGLMAAAIVATHPRILFYSVQVLSEVPFAFLGLCCFLFLGSARGESRRAVRRALWAGLAGAVGGAVFLTRPEGVLLLPLGAVALLVPLRRGAIGAAVFAVAFLAVAAPQVARVSDAVGGFSLGAKSDYNLALGYAGHPDVPAFDMKRTVYNNFTGNDPFHPPRGSAFEPDPVPRFSFPRFALRHPDTVLSHVWKQLPYALGAVFSLAYAPWALLALVGVVARRRRWTGGETLWFSGWILYVGLYSLVFVFRRFFLLFLPLLLVESAAGVLAVAGGASRSRLRGGLSVGLGGVLLVAGVVMGKGVVERGDYRVEAREAGLLLAEAAGSEPELARRPRVAAVQPHAGYYAGAPILFLPALPPRELTAELRARGVRWFLIDAVDRGRPAFAPWGDPATARELGVVERGRMGETVIYELPATPASRPEGR